MEAAGGCRSDAASNATRLTYIDGLRAIAVLAIVVWHGAQGASHPAAPPAFWLWGNRGVDLFFVISGFCLSYPFLKAYRRTNTLRIDYADFLVRRISRIAPPYYAAVALFAVLATTSFGLPTTWFAQARAGWQEIVLDLFFLTSRAPLHNASFWTLGVEMRWYLLCPLLIALFVRSRTAFTIVLLALWTSYTLTPWSISDLGMLPCFMLGIVAAHVALGPPRYRRITFVVASGTVGIALYQSLNGEIDHGNPLWHLACFLIVVCARDGALRGILSWPPLVAAGRASFAIYLVHEPFLIWFGFHGFHWVVASAGSIVAGSIFWYLVERNVVRTRVRMRIEAVLRKAVRRFVVPPIVVDTSLITAPAP